MANIEIDPITGAPIIKPKDSPSVINPIMPVVAEPTSSPGLNKPAATTPIVIPAPTPFIAPATTPVVPPTKSVAPPVQPSAALAKAMENAALNVTADATVEESANHISSLYPEIKRILREGGGDTQQQEQTFAKLKELLDEVVWSDS